MKRRDYFVLHHEETIDDLRRDTNHLISKINAMDSSERNLTRPDLFVAIHIEGRYTVSIFENTGDLAEYCGKLDPAKNTLGWMRISELSDETTFAAAARAMRGPRWKSMIRLGFATRSIASSMAHAA